MKKILFSLLFYGILGSVGNSAFATVSPCNLSLSQVTTDALCSGSHAGTITITPHGGTAAYSYTINGTDIYSNVIAVTNSTGYFTNLNGGAYVITVTDASSCSASIGASVAEYTPIIISTSKIDLTCKGGNSGSITVSATGGANWYPGYKYSIDGINFNFVNVFSSLTAGTYTVYVKDQAGCVKTQSVTLNEPSTAIALSQVTTDVPCNGNHNGSITVTPQYALSPYSYTINGTDVYNNVIAVNNNTGSFTNLNGGSYIVTLVDANGCTQSIGSTVSEYSALNLSSTVSDVNCKGGTGGSITLSTTGGAGWYPGYKYSIDGINYNFVNVFGSLAAGSYTVYVKDQNNCIKSKSLNVNQPLLDLTATQVSTNVPCSGAQNGTITVTPNGGTPSYSYALTGTDINSNPVTASNGTGIFSSLSGGSYNVMVTDNHGCTKSVSSTLSESTPIVVTATAAGVNCNGGSNGTVTVTATGGNPGYKYSIDGINYSTVNTFTGLSGGLKTVYVKDNNNCIKTKTVTVPEPLVLTLAQTVTDAPCTGTHNGAVNIVPSGGTAAYTYVLTGTDVFSNPISRTNSTGSFTGMDGGFYNVLVTDSKGCTASSNSTVAGYLPIVISASISCTVVNTGSITASATGGANWGPGFKFSLDGISYSYTNTFGSLPAGPQTVYVKDQMNCVMSKPVNVGTCNTASKNSNIANTTQEFSVYPNPSNGQFNILLLASDDNANFLVTDYSGRVVSVNIISKTADKISFDMVGVSSGIYMVQVNTNGQILRSKLIVQK